MAPCHTGLGPAVSTAIRTSKVALQRPGPPARVPSGQGPVPRAQQAEPPCPLSAAASLGEALGWGTDPAQIPSEEADPQDSGKEPVVALRSHRSIESERVDTPEGHEEAHTAYANYGLSWAGQPPWIKASEVSTRRGLRVCSTVSDAAFLSLGLGGVFDWQCSAVLLCGSV